MAKNGSTDRAGKLTRTVVHLTNEQIAELDSLRDDTGLARNTQIRLAVNQYLQRERRRLARDSD